jgi:hypothetical protein
LTDFLIDQPDKSRSTIDEAPACDGLAIVELSSPPGSAAKCNVGSTAFGTRPAAD